jgi:platelet-activating factor acetylhydrolase IB subunit beta/gamma
MFSSSGPLVLRIIGRVTQAGLASCKANANNSRPLFSRNQFDNRRSSSLPLCHTKPNIAMADTPDTSTDSGTAETTTKPELEPTMAFTALQTIAKFKARSHDTSKNTHIPLLHSHTTNNAPNHGPTVVLIGDSMFERMATTGQTPNFTAPWPSPAMLDDATLAKISDTHTHKPPMTRLTRVFNAGVGGDKIQNIAYRLVGAPHPDDVTQNLPGLLPMLARCGTVRVWAVQAGTNNLSPKQGLRDVDVAALGVLVETLRGVGLWGGEGCGVLVTGLFYRKDVSVELVDKANEKVGGLCKGLEQRFGEGRVRYLHPTAAVKVEEHLVDHVHLSLDGYRVWAEELFMAVSGMLRELEQKEKD